MVAGDDVIALELAVFDRSVGRRQEGFAFLVGPQPDHLVGELAVVHFAIRGDQEAVFVDGRIDRQAGDQADVRAFRRFDRADAAVVRNVHVAHFEAGPLAVQTAGPKRRQSPLVREHRKRVRLVDHLRQLAAAEEVFDRRRNALGIDQAARRHVFDVLQAHPLLHRAAELEKALAQFVGRQLVDRPQPAIAQVVDVVDLDPRFAAGQLQHIADGRDQVLGPQGHFGLGHAELQLAVDAEAADLAQAVTIGIEKFLVEQRPGFFQLGRIARPQPLVDAQQRLFVAGGRVLGQAVEDQRVLGVDHYFDRGQAGGADQLGDVLGDLLAALEDDLAGLFAVVRIDDVVDRDLAFDLAGAAAVDDLFAGRIVKHADQIGVQAEFRIHGAEQRHGRELAALVDADTDRVLLARVQLDPASALGNDAATERAAVAGLQLADVVDARAAVQLADHDAFGAVDDELAAAEHDRHVAEIDFFLDRLLLGQLEPDAERPAIGQSQLATLVRLVPRLAQLVAQVFEPQRLVVAFDRKDFAQHRLDPLIDPLAGGLVVLQEPLVTAGLDLGEIGDLMGSA